MQKRTWLMAAAMLASVAPATAQTIYPLNRAEILEGSRFDFKVEFPNAPASADVKVTINGKPIAEAFGREVQFVQNEEGQKHSALWLRGAQLPAGQYVVEAAQGGEKATVNWNVYATGERKAKNVILFIGDGMSVAHRTAARILSKGWEQGLYGGELAIDDMPNMALISTSGTDSIVTDSANSASAYTTGHKSCVNALGIYCAKNALTLDHPKVETISEVIKRKRSGMAIGVVTNSEIEDATPASMVAHTRRRSDFNDIVKMFFDVQPDVIMGGGSPNFLPKSTPGTKRTDDQDFIAKFKEAGYALATTKTEMNAAVAGGSKKLLGLYNTSNIDGAFDLRLAKKGSISKFPDQPDVVEQTKAALEMLKGNEDGFFLMVESARIDKYSHSLDWERAVFDTIMLDNAVKAAKDFAGERNDTLIIVVADHAHPVSLIGSYNDDRPGQLLRDKLGVYQDSVVPNYGPRDADGYPTDVNTSHRLAVVFGTYPDTCDTGRPYMDGERVPAVAGAEKNTYVANEKDCTAPMAVRKQGNLPFESNSGVHAADDVVLTAMGPGAEKFRGHKPNTYVFRVMTEALSLGGK